MKPNPKMPLIVRLRGREVSIDRRNLQDVVAECIQEALAEEAAAGRAAKIRPENYDALFREVTAQVLERAILPPASRCEIFSHPRFKGQGTP